MLPVLQNRSGFALPLLIVLLLAGSVGGMLASSVAMQQIRNSRRLDASVRAIHAAESGGAFIVNALASKTYTWGADGKYEDDDLAPWGGGTTHLHGRDLWWLKSLEFSGNTVTMRIIGQDGAGIASREIEIIYTMDPQTVSAFGTAVVGCSGVNLSGSGQIDSYNSSLGPYNPSNANANASVATLSGDLVISGSSPIKGEIHIAGNLSMTGSAQISGVVKATGNITYTGNPHCPIAPVLAGGTVKEPGSWWCSSSRHFITPNADVPSPSGTCDPLDVSEYVDKQLVDASKEGIQQTGNYNGWKPTPIDFNENPNFTDDFRVGAGNTVNFRAGDVNQIYVDGDFKLGGGAKVRLQAPYSSGTSGRIRLFIDGDLEMGGGTTFIIEEGVALEVYVTGTVKMGGGLTNMNASPTIVTTDENGEEVVLPSFAIYSSNDQANGVDIGGDSQIFASVYAPLTDVNVHGSGGLYGAVRGRSVKVTGADGIHYDEALGDVQSSVVAEGGNPRVVNWRDIF